jgi:hypothetical protein
MPNMSTGLPAQKVMGSTIGAALASLVISVFQDVLPASTEIPLVTIVTFLVGYFMPPSRNDTLVPGDSIGLLPSVAGGAGQPGPGMGGQGAGN